MQDIADSCRNVLDKLERTIHKYGELKSDTGSVGRRIKRAWKRLNWEPEDIKELRGRIGTNIGLLNAFNGRLTRDNVVTLVRHQEDQEHQPSSTGSPRSTMLLSKAILLIGDKGELGNGFLIQKRSKRGKRLASRRCSAQESPVQERQSLQQSWSTISAPGSKKTQILALRICTATSNVTTNRS